ncbi:MAG TPA: amidohydrolase [Planctomycetaceae bacterium]|nr:amidohydrolase [Planctomycetaceae bacterium]
MRSLFPHPVGVARCGTLTRLVVTFAGWFSCAGGPATADESPDLVLHSGHVITVDSRFSIAQALAVRGGKLVAVGTNDTVRALAGPNTRQIDLAGGTVLPGLIDSHTHPVAAALHEFDHPIPEMDTIADVLAYIASRAAVVPEGEWITLRQVFITRLRDQRYPTRRELDQAAPRHPVMFATGPDAALNSLALQESGITRETQVTDGGPGQIEKDPQTGELTGILRSCTRLAKPRGSAPGATSAEQRERLKQLLSDYNRVGLTSITDKDASESEYALFRELHQAGELTCRVYIHASVDAQQPVEELARQFDRIAADPGHQWDPWLWRRGVKCYLDGGMLTGSAYLRQPWGKSRIYSITDPEYRGLRYIDSEKLLELVRLSVKHDLQFTAHSVGDGAVHALLDAYGTVNDELRARAEGPVPGDARPGAGPERSPAPIAGCRFSLTHANFQSREAVDQMRDLGVVCDLQPAWLWLDGATLRAQFGDNRLEFFQPYRSLFEAGVMVGGGSDHMQKIGSLRSVNPYNPFLGMWITLARQPRRGGEPLHPGQKLTRPEAIRLYTIQNAWLTFEERFKGSLEPGKMADFVILDRDILSCPEEQIPEIQVRQTWVDGRLVYRGD